VKRPDTQEMENGQKEDVRGGASAVKEKVNRTSIPKGSPLAPAGKEKRRRERKKKRIRVEGEKHQQSRKVSSVEKKRPGKEKETHT